MDTEPRKIPTQARSKAVVLAIVQAGARVLTTEGVQALTTARIAEVAGVSIGSLYQYFPSKEAVVSAVIRSQLQTDLVAMRGLLTKVPDTSLKEKLTSLGEQACAYQAHLSPLLEQLLPLLAPLGQDPVLQEWMADVTELFVAFLLEYRDELAQDLQSPTELTLAAEVLIAGIRANLTHASLHAPERLTDPIFHAEIARLSYGILR